MFELRHAVRRARVTCLLSPNSCLIRHMSIPTSLRDAVLESSIQVRHTPMFAPTFENERAQTARHIRDVFANVPHEVGNPSIKGSFGP